MHKTQAIAYRKKQEVSIIILGFQLKILILKHHSKCMELLKNLFQIHIKAQYFLEKKEFSFNNQFYIIQYIS
jgi:hypothetical protein